MEILNTSMNFVIEKFDILFSGAGIPLLIALGTATILLANKVNTAFKKFKLKKTTLADDTTYTPKQEVKVAPAQKKNPLTAPRFKRVSGLNG